MIIDNKTKFSEINLRTNRFIYSSLRNIGHGIVFKLEFTIISNKFIASIQHNTMSFDQINRGIVNSELYLMIKK